MNTLEIHTFEAATMPEALAKVRGALGPDAVILQTRQQTKRGLTGTKIAAVEIIATPANDTSAKLLRPSVQPVKTQPPGESNLEDMQQTIAYLTELVDDLMKGNEDPTDPQWSQWREQLLTAGFPGDEVEQCRKFLLQNGCITDWAIRHGMREYFQGKVRCQPSIALDTQRGLLALVGPPGAGKTTTIAKLAAQTHLWEGKRVLVISTDVRRIGAVEQAQTFSEIIGVEFAAPKTRTQLQQLLLRSKDVDLILVDTDSQSRPEGDALAIQRDLAAAGCECHLVVDANMKYSSLEGAMSRYAPLQYKRIILTKLDEVERPLEVLGTALRLDRPLSFVTTGSRVPDDLQAADSQALIDFAFSSTGVESRNRAA